MKKEDTRIWVLECHKVDGTSTYIVGYITRKTATEFLSDMLKKEVTGTEHTCEEGTTYRVLDLDTYLAVCPREHLADYAKETIWRTVLHDMNDPELHKWVMDNNPFR